MAAAPAADQKPNRAALARDARRLADEVESLYIQLSQIGALATTRRFMLIQEEGVPNFDLLQTAKALRCYAGTLSLIAASAKPKTAPKHCTVTTAHTDFNDQRQR